jgi:cysteine synthase
VKSYQSVIEMIGNTPLLRLNRLSPEHQIYGKCEFMNPLSIKDRPVLQIIKDAEESGQLQPGATLIEMTSGNTGMAVAYMAAIKGYRAIMVMSEGQSIERRKILQAFGAELELTPANEGTVGSRKRLREILEEHPDYFYVGQHVNPSNPKVHYLTTGPEIWEDTEGKVDILVASMGTGGTISGVGRYLKEKNPAVQLIAFEPEESPFISQGIFKRHHLMGTTPGFVPETLNQEIIDEIILINEAESFAMCRQLAVKEGILVGISSGAAAHIALKVAERPENDGKNIVCILVDTGQRYLSVEDLF